MKKILALILILMLVMTALVSCGGDKEDGGNTNDQSSEQSDTIPGGIDKPTEPENTSNDNVVEF